MTNKVFIKQELTGTQGSEESDQVLDLRKCGIGGKVAVDRCRRPSDEQSGVLNSCTWCGKKGDFKDAGAPTGFCSSVCFDQYRRDCFKKRSACIWCSASASRQNLISNAASVDESKFCSPQCLAQFKVRVFCEETTAHLDQLKDVNMIRPEVIDDLITPELWLHQSFRRNPMGNEKQADGSSSKSSSSQHKRSSSSASVAPQSPVELMELAKRPHLIPQQDYRHHHHVAGIRRRAHRSNHMDLVTRSTRSQLDKQDDILVPLIPAATQTNSKNTNSGGNGKHRQVLKQMENGSAAVGLMKQTRMPVPPVNVPGIDSLQLFNPFTSSSEDTSSWNQQALIRENLSCSAVNGRRAKGVNEISGINYVSPGIAVSSSSSGTKTKEGPNLNPAVISLSGCQGRNNDILFRQNNRDNCNREATNFMSNSQCYPILLPIPVPIPIPFPIFIPHGFQKNFSSLKSYVVKNQESGSDSKKAGTSEAITENEQTKGMLSSSGDCSPSGLIGLSNRVGNISSHGSESFSEAIKDDESYD